METNDDNSNHRAQGGDDAATVASSFFDFDGEDNEEEALNLFDDCTGCVREHDGRIRKQVWMACALTFGIVAASILLFTQVIPFGPTDDAMISGPVDSVNLFGRSWGIETESLIYYWQLYEPIPTQIGLLSKLTNLGLSSAYLEGSMPSEIGLLTALTKLDVYGNEMTGKLPTQLGKLTALYDLNLFSNQFTGPVPSEFGRLTELKWLQLHQNKLSGSVPSELGELMYLNSLSIQSNEFEGSIPTEMCEISSLKSLIRDCDPNPVPLRCRCMDRCKCAKEYRSHHS